ncbi:hypothetical protein B7017_1606b [Bifidobacterium breve JCM 7017]|nr:hypothetical protein B7017_1606b [Bifidobacterium breve JCM 7017]
MIGGDGINDESNKTAPAPTRNTDLTKNRERLARPKSTLRHSKISIHAPRRGSDDLADLILDTISRISIHASPDGERPGASAPGCGRSYFNPRSPDGERPNQLLTNPSSQGISIHAPRMGSDGGGKHHRSWTNISIHAPRMGSDGIPLDANRISSRFQSTLPGWGATSSWSPASTRVRHFNPRSPDGERRCGSLCGISPVGYFNPRSPDGERQRDRGQRALCQNISIHAPRMGSDSPDRNPRSGTPKFQSTLPGGGATTSRTSSSTPSAGFQSTLPGWGATGRIGTWVWTIIFQSTLPGWGATQSIVNQSI